MSDPRAEQAEQPTEEEMKAYLEQLRDADPAEIVAQAYTMLGTGAEVKLGRPDARVLIDAMGALAEVTQGTLGDDLVTRMRNGVVQLQTAQVQAEREAGDAGQQAEVSQAAGPETPPGPAGQGQASAPPKKQWNPGDEDESMTDRLWIPGRGPS